MPYEYLSAAARAHGGTPPLHSSGNRRRPPSPRAFGDTALRSLTIEYSPPDWPRTPGQRSSYWRSLAFMSG